MITGEDAEIEDMIDYLAAGASADLEEMTRRSKHRSPLYQLWRTMDTKHVAS
jgi:adenosyl cobinamide kinase/adenosyl cobinamide phosphate guanylyltransferase